MKRLGAVRFPDFIFDIPDTTIRLACSTAGTAIDLPDGTNYIRVTALSTAASPAPIYPYMSMGSTAVAIPTTGQSSGSTAFVRTVNDRVYPTGGSTEISLICLDSSGYAMIDCWK